jgi:hypothetical protein
MTPKDVMIGTSPTPIEYLVALELRHRRTYARSLQSRHLRDATARRHRRLGDLLGR